jgi:hypothetical protein
MSPDELLVGAWDVHVHVAPSLFPRWGDGWDLAEECRAASMRGVVLKAHHGSTVEVAAMIDRHFEGLTVLGGVVLNQFVGGIHPLVVEQTMAIGGRFVWMPTIHAAHHGAATGRLGAFSFQGEPLSHTPATGLSVLGPSGQVLPGVREILALLDGTNVVLGTGHLAPVEILALRRSIVDDRRRVRLLVNHVLFTVPNLDTEQLEALSGSDVYFELCDFSCSPMANATTPAKVASYLSVLPNARWVMASDSGQRDNAHSPEALMRYCTALTREGVGQEFLERMLKTHPAELMA